MNHDDQLTQVLGAGIESFDIPEDQFKVAKFAYKAACDFLSTYWADNGTGGALYPQGSMRLGTVTALIHRHDEYDLDMVCRHDLEMSKIDPEDLKADVGDALEHFVKEHPELRLTLDDEGRRCWTFVHDLLPFHMDVLPAIPNADTEPNGIWATDTEGSRWHPSAPTDYAEWFLGVLHDEWLAGAATDRRVPADGRRAVAAQRLQNHTAADRPGHVECPFGRYVIANPVEPGENFADRWIGHPVRARRFFEWLEAAQRDFTAIGDAHDTDGMLNRTALALGIRAAGAAEQAITTGPTARRLAMVATRVPAGSDRFA